MTIRNACQGDLDAILELYTALFAEMAALQPAYWRAAGASRAFLTEFMAGEQNTLLVAEKEGVLLGFVLANEQNTPPYDCIVPHRYAYLMDMAVRPDTRSQGVGAALIGAVKAWAKGRGLGYVELNVLEENTRAAALYHREGFAGAMRTLRCPL